MSETTVQARSDAEAGAGIDARPDLVTGASGFVGSHLALALARAGRPVRALVRCTPLPEPLVAAGVETVRGDLAAPATLPAALAGVGRVFHCAARVADWGSRAEFETANVRGTANLLEAVRGRRVTRLVHFSTTDVYGFPARPRDETAPVVRRGWPYGDTKIAAEQLVWREAGRTGLPVTVLRPGNVYGPGSHSFVGEIAGLLRARGMIHVGLRPRPAGLCHVRNLVDAALLAAGSPRAPGQAYNVTDGSDLTWRDAVEALADGLGLPRPRLTVPRPLAYGAGWLLERLAAAQGRPRRPLLTRMAVELLSADQSFSIGKARRELGYAPRGDFRAAVPELVRWLEGGPPC